ncbi:DNA polymerase III subunit gamma/tau [Thalassotalea sp. HSM 43]|uniref:DNA polymerase III subunit gamma/tau n=1 Tax=Thalassotalea sp. HSM 43 TaxID=2552945 RepID=UPI001080D41A|nr:DNA polymerase III subunit gamma/tau [Thalassotalea sp. HSM 43]QBY03088.1 DNA polymerase III subunit gamma/tau [Thalassotalea sp. HSM 43]
MSYQVLARKWRPKDFTQLMGQEHVVTVLMNALSQQRLHHAYLFTGTRGVGKTTIARIFAKSLNCEQGVTANPCGQCDVCLDIDAGRFVDLLEIDAASRTKVDDTREILDNVQYAPSRGRYKVYLIDEVHMLSKSSFNALLKTLEEPPEHVKFILATTDPQKLPVTVLSRCLQFHLKALTPTQIETKLKEILDAETVTFEEDAIALLAKAARGSMRDSLSLTDQAIAQGQGHIVADNVVQMLGGVDQNWVYKILVALLKQNPQELMQLSQDIASYAPNYHRLLAELLQLLHQVALWQLVPNGVDLDAQKAKLIDKFARAMAPEDVQLYYQIAVNGRKDLAYAGDEQSGFDMVMLRMLAFKPAASHQALTSAIPDNATQTIEFDADTEQSTATTAAVQSVTPAAEPEKKAKAEAAPKAEPTPEPKSEPKPELKPEPTPEPTPELKPEPELELSSADEQNPTPQADVFAAKQMRATSAEQLQSEQQQLEAMAEVQRAPASEQLPTQTTEQAIEPVLHSEQQAQPVQQTPQQSAEPQVDNQQPVADNVNSDVEKMLATRNMLRSRRKAAEDTGKKPSAPVAKATLSPPKVSSQSSQQVDSQQVEAQQATAQSDANTSEFNLSATDANTAEAEAVDVSRATATATQNATVEPTALSQPHDDVAVAEAPISEEKSTEAPVTEGPVTEGPVTVATSTAQANPTAEHQSHQAVNLCHSNEFNADVIDPAVIRDANQIDSWAHTIDAMGLSGRVRQLALNAELDLSTTDSQLVINLDNRWMHLNSPAALESMKACYSNLKQQQADVIINPVDEPKSTPFVIQQIINEKRLAWAKQLINDDDFVTALQQQFQAFVDENSIMPL